MNNRISNILTILIWGTITTIGLILTPNPIGLGTHQQLGLPPCFSKLFFDGPCPTCGLTTSFTAFLHGQLVESFSAHFYGPMLYLALTFMAFSSAYELKNKRKFLPYRDFYKIPLLVFALSFVLYGLIRYLLNIL